MAPASLSEHRRDHSVGRLVAVQDNVYTTDPNEYCNAVPLEELRGFLGIGVGWGEPAAYNHVVSLVYAEKDGSDPGNVYYIRSTDSGVTFSAPCAVCDANNELIILPDT